MNIKPRSFCSPCGLGLALALVSAWPAGTRAADALTDPALLGCWRAERVEQSLADGGLWIDIGGCTLDFTAERIVSACVLRAGNRPITYAYRIVEPGRYTARITDHPARPQAVGSERDYEYRIDRDRLYITTYPQTTKPAPLSAVVQVLSMSVRVGSAADLATGDDREKAGCEGRLVGVPASPRLAAAGREPH